MHPDIAGSERLAIFVLDSEDMKADGASWRAFMPSKDGERSFFRVDDLEFADIAKIGREVAAERGKTLRGWVIVRASDVPPRLKAKSDDPPDRHGVIFDWPTDRNDKRSLAQSLADIAEGTIRYPTPQGK